MVTEVRIYAEGGGDRDDTRTRFRQGLSKFLRDLQDLARERRIRWQIIACGSREATYDAFEIATRANHRTAFNVLLVDAEEAVTQLPWQHLAQRDSWICPEGATEDHCYLMVQCMEAWLMADRDTLYQYYGQGFLLNALPRTKHIESVAKDELSRRLEHATKQTEKGKYHKIRHGTELLAKVNTAIVRKACPHCERLFATLRRVMTESA